jgi:FkbM family methyltransferase
MNRIKKNLKFFAKKLLLKFKFYFILPTDIRQQINYFYQKKKIFMEKNFIDIGANEGNWSLAFKSISKNCNYILFEPNRKHNFFLNKISKDVYNNVLFKEKQKKIFRETDSEKGLGNSIYKEKSNAKFRETTVQAVTLDDIIKKLKINQFEIIKIDTQGSELDIMKGGLKTLKKTKFLILELHKKEYNLSPNTNLKTLKFLQKIHFKKVKNLSNFGKGIRKANDILFENTKFK